jgi:hypothetical protein
MRRLLLTLPVFSAILAGCLVQPANPCDPAADESIRETGTLSGVVVDQDEEPVSGVTVVIVGRGDTTTSQPDGTFEFTGLPPNDGPLGYELATFPQAPAVGGRLFAPPVACRAEVADVTLHVALAPDVPEVEIVQATADDRLFVGFSAVDPDARYVVELRSPFGSWRRALMADDPWTSEIAAEALASPTAAVEGTMEEISDTHAQALCDDFRYVHPSLSADNARCAEVIGVADDIGELWPLQTHGSYHVRVRAQQELPVELLAEQLPEIVRSEATGAPAQTSLVPTAILPVMMGSTVEESDEMMSGMEVHAIVPTGDGRFAMIDGDSMAVIGQGDVLDSSYAAADGAAMDAMVYDDGASTAAMSDVAEDSGRALAVLPAGRWVRVWKERDDGAGGTSSEVEKVFVGAAQATEDHNSTVLEPEFSLDFASGDLADDFRAFEWLWIPAGANSDQGYNPPDAYMLQFRQGVVFLERERLGDAGVLAASFGADVGDGLLDGEWGQNSDGSAATTSGLCAGLGADATGFGGGSIGDRTTRVCLDLEVALGETLDLVASDLLAATAGENARDQSFNLFADRAGDRVLAVRTDRFLGEVAGRLVDGIESIPVGVEPAGLHISRRLDCASGGEKPIALVANEGSLDVSVLEVSGSGDSLRVEETATFGLPAAPVGFFDDPDGVSCADPFAWALTDDGRMFPLDMRADRFGPPQCGDDVCAVRTRGRADTGAVSRSSEGRARVLVGGRGMLGEVGFLRPGN